jgi:hypothetical protein
MALWALLVMPVRYPLIPGSRPDDRHIGRCRATTQHSAPNALAQDWRARACRLPYVDVYSSCSTAPYRKLIASKVSICNMH